MQWRIQDFPDGGATPNFGVKNYYLARFCQKLHESARNWTESWGLGGDMSLVRLSGSANGMGSFEYLAFLPK